MNRQIHPTVIGKGRPSVSSLTQPQDSIATVRHWMVVINAMIYVLQTVEIITQYDFQPNSDKIINMRVGWQ